MTKADDLCCIGALSVNESECYGQDFHKMHAPLLKQLINSAKKIEPNFPSCGDEIAEPHPGMHIKVAAFTVSQKSNNTKVFRQMREQTKIVMNEKKGLILVL